MLHSLLMSVIVQSSDASVCSHRIPTLNIGFNLSRLEFRLQVADKTNFLAPASCYGGIRFEHG